MKYILTLIFLWSFEISQINSTKEPICASSFDSSNRKHEIVNCNLLDHGIKFNLECKVVLNYHVNTIHIHDGIKVDLRLFYQFLPSSSNLVNETFFKWASVSEHTRHKSVSFSSTFDSNTRLENNLTVNMEYVNRTMASQASLFLYNINEEKMYRICPFFDLLDNNSVCCEVEIKKEEETLFEMNFFMCLVLVGLLVVIYAIVSLVFCICPSGEYKSIDEMLTKMPDDQVKVLKEMVRNERNSMKEKEAHCDHGFENFGAVFDADDTYGINDDNLYVEINKKRQSIRSMKRERKKSVLSDVSGGIDNLEAKIAYEEKRRASLGPYMKPYALQNIYDSD